MTKRRTLGDLIDLNVDIHACKVKINGKNQNLVALTTNPNGKKFAQIEGGWYIEISEERYHELVPILREHIKKIS